jgi:hypothetical protein
LVEIPGAGVAMLGAGGGASATVTLRASSAVLLSVS